MGEILNVAAYPCYWPEGWEKAFTGFTALAAENPRRTWREVFLWPPNAAVLRGAIEARFRELAAECHPDRRGGSHENFVELSKARDEALAELERPLRGEL